MTARDRLRDEVTKGNIWGEPANLDQLIDDVIAEALRDPQHHNAVMAILRRESRLLGKPIHELGEPGTLRPVVGETSCTLTYPPGSPAPNPSVVIEITGEHLDAEAIEQLRKALHRS